MREIERLVVRLVSNGCNNIRRIAFELENEKLVNECIRNLINKGYLKKDNDRILLTLKGLLLASKKHKTTKITLKKGGIVPSFENKNNLGRDFIFLPYLRFDSHENKLDNNSYKFYRTELKLRETNCRVTRHLS